MDVHYLETHPALVTAPQIGEICKPLEQLGITYFSFVRSYKDGSHIRLSNNPAWTKHYYSCEFYNVVLKQVPDENGNILWASIDRHPLFYDASEHFEQRLEKIIYRIFQPIKFQTILYSFWIMI